jgi:hypothetical protein
VNKELGIANAIKIVFKKIPDPLKNKKRNAQPDTHRQKK